MPVYEADEKLEIRGDSVICLVQAKLFVAAAPDIERRVCGHVAAGELAWMKLSRRIGANDLSEIFGANEGDVRQREPGAL